MNLSIKQLTAMVKMAFDIAKADGEATESEYQIISTELQAFGVTRYELKTWTMSRKERSVPVWAQSSALTEKPLMRKLNSGRTSGTGAVFLQ